MRKMITLLYNHFNRTYIKKIENKKFNVLKYSSIFSCFSIKLQKYISSLILIPIIFSVISCSSKLLLEENLFQNGSVLSRTFKNGKYYFIEKYYTNGNLFLSAPISNCSGFYRLFYPNNKIMYEIEINTNKKSIIGSYFSETGAVELREFYSNEINLSNTYLLSNMQITDGNFECYYKNGKKKFITFLKDGREQNSAIRYYYSGNIMQVDNLNNGKRDGRNKFFFENGTIYTMVSYSNDILEGESITFFENGTTNYYSQFKNGLLNGKSFRSFNNGEKRIEYTCKTNVLNGIVIEYHTNNQIAVIMNFRDGKPDGLQEIFNEELKMYILSLTPELSEFINN